MALIIKDRVRETTTTTGIGTITLAGASTGFRSFADIGNANTTYYCISNNNEFEVGVGTYTASGTTLSRDTVLSNSLGTTAKIDFSAGSKDVFVTYPSDKSINKDASGNVGIGTTSPTAILTLARSNDFPFVHWNNSTNTTIAFAGWHGGSGGGDDFRIGTQAAKAVTLQTNNTEKMRIHSSGGVSIGSITDSGANNLSVAGAIVSTRITPRVSTTASDATPTINTDNTDQFGLTAQAVDITSFTTNLSGTPTDGQKLWIYIVGTAARAIAWGASFESSTATLPTTTVTTNRLDVGFVWNTATSKWRCVAVA
jgi:hypothetical protein